MNPVDAWLNPPKVRSLSEQLLRPVPTVRLTPQDAGFGASFVGFTSEDAPDGTAPPPRPNHPPTSSAASQERFMERILIFRDWLAKNFQATDVFLLDHKGRIIFDESGRERLHLIARNFANATSRTGDIRVKIGSSAILELIPCDTSQGRIMLGALVPVALPAKHVLAITEILIKAASPP